MVKTVRFNNEITLGQFLKAEGIISTGGQAKWYLQDNPVLLNGEEEARRGKKLHEDDILEIEGEGKYKISYLSAR
ncbi:S4 domain-containing protein YaaA [Macrococcus equipercicus]|uniref:S4 domain-containing protein YaaA n=1 Tax=Macrococcus equipercicus TaxID=69967 RepID=A0A9Q9BME5_9STAP|nr:S4 domain-containing protein YaaA [Macrococcus equipercicus]KAA1039521.1 S4 domain-containing protein YaaA [Macrococcus equipercicus]UTH13805.1 S4 domain-containing protein YaaA [Macrococcus equipercicus]